VIKEQSTDLIEKNQLFQHNKISLFFLELSEFSKRLFPDTKFLKIYENFKHSLKFYYNSIKSLESKLIESTKIKRILVVDDNKLILKALKNMLRIIITEFKLNNKIEVISAYDGVDALSIFKIDHFISQSINIIITDQNMSMMEGGDLIKLVERYKQSRNIKLYISSTDNEVLKNLNIKNVEFLSKPARKSELKKIIDPV